MLELLLEAGASLPAVGVDVGQPVITELELAWEDQKVGLALDCAPEDEAALRRDGWTLVSAARGDAASIERAGAELAQLLGVRVAGDEGGTDAEPVDLAEPEA
jgi:hypothetical protein